MTVVRLLAVVTVVGLSALCWVSAAYAGAPPEQIMQLFNQGNRLYQADDFAGSRQAYERILDLGYEAADVYYNLGNASLNLGDLGRAIWAYARARRLAPRDEDIIKNLGYARALTSDARPSGGGSRLLAWLARVSERLPAKDILRVCLVLYWLLSGLLLAMLLRPRLRRRLAPGGWGMGLLLGLSLVFAGMKAVVAEASDVGVVLPAEVSVQSAPGEEGKPVFTLHAGTEVRMSRTLGGWVEITLGPELKGWVHGDTIAEI